jgi:hypothetical protein
MSWFLQEQKMKSRTVLSVVSLLMALLPVASHADDTREMQACMKAFVATYLAPAQAAKVRVALEKSGGFPAWLRFAPAKYELTASSSRSGREIAKVTCTVSSDGVVTAMIDAPESQQTATSVEVASR